jgi:hypothetical protein
LARALQLFGKLSFATLQDINELRHEVALQIAVRLNYLPELHTEHIPRIPHTSRAQLPKKLAIPLEVLIPVERMLCKTTENMGNMRGRVLRLLERGDKRNYQEWLTRQQEVGQITQSQAEDR